MCSRVPTGTLQDFRPKVRFAGKPIVTRLVTWLCTGFCTEKFSGTKLKTFSKNLVLKFGKISGTRTQNFS